VLESLTGLRIEQLGEKLRTVAAAPASMLPAVPFPEPSEKPAKR
jgi:hypothetical protein